MTLESVFQQWAATVTWDATATTPAAVIPADRNAAKTPTMKGYIVCDVTGVESSDITGDTRKEYPFKVKFIPGDGVTGTSGTDAYTLDMRTMDVRGSTGDYSDGNEAVSGKFVPVNNGLMRHILSFDWIIGSSTDFETVRDGESVIW